MPVPTRLPVTFPEQAARRFEASRAELHALGWTAGLPFRTIAVLTTDLPGEAIEVAVILEDGSSRLHRAKPLGVISPGASRIHGLIADDLRGELPLRSRQRHLEALLLQSGPDGEPVPTVAWAGRFVSQALNNSFDTPFNVPLLDLQSAVHAADLHLNPDSQYRPMLSGMLWTVDVPLPDRTSALSMATVTRQVLLALLEGTPIQHPPRLSERHST